MTDTQPLTITMESIPDEKETITEPKVTVSTLKKMIMQPEEVIPNQETHQVLDNVIALSSSWKMKDLDPQELLIQDKYELGCIRKFRESKAINLDFFTKRIVDSLIIQDQEIFDNRNLGKEATLSNLEPKQEISINKTVASSTLKNIDVSKSIEPKKKWFSSKKNIKKI